MLSEQNLYRLVKATETLSERDSDTTTLPNKSVRASINAAQAAPILSYLLEPYEFGYWELRARWNSASPLANFLIEALGTLSEIEKDTETTPFLSISVARKLAEEKREELLRLTSRLSAIHSLFRAIAKTSLGGDLPRLSELDSWIKKVDFTQVKSQFNKGWTIFKDDIYFDGFIAGVGNSKPFRIKTSFVSCLEAPRENGILHLVGTHQSDISTLRNFYEALGVIKDATVCRVFAPDEALFKPYFSFVSSVLPHIIHDGQSSKVFSQALAYYEEEDYQHCISTLGLISEDYLQRIYTSLLREQISGGLTLGQTLDRIHKRVDELFQPTKVMQKDPNSAYEQIRSLEHASDVESLKSILRELVGLIQDDRLHYSRRLDEIIKPVARRTPFPSRVADNLNELLRWRNAASHNSRVALGAHEADRTLYCLVSLVSWWQEQLVKIDWSKSKLEIIESLLHAAKAPTSK